MVIEIAPLTDYVWRVSASITINTRRVAAKKKIAYFDCETGPNVARRMIRSLQL